MGVLHKIGNGLYKLGQETIYYPEITRNIKIVYTKISKQFPYASFCIWYTASLNEFMVHQPGKFLLMVEVEKDAAESVFYFVKEFHKDVFLNPNEEIYRNYIAGKQSVIIVKTLISEAPVQEIYDVKTPIIEKILVDLFCDKVVYSSFQGAELRNIFINVFNKYTVNITSLLRYADRRGKKKELESYINQFTNFRQ